VRVVGGELGGRSLRAPAGRRVRPTSDRVREALFSMLHALGSPAGARVLDLFAGSGALGIEALSRGAERATFVDRSPVAIACVRDNLEALGLAAEVHLRTARAFLEQAREASRQYDLIFLDPPYGQASALGDELSAGLGGVLSPGAHVVAESDRRAPLVLKLPLVRERRYGDTLIRIHAEH
jgi:16S rRNA (guanine966-N2)-methyltransferase